jgi:hypothetical protein
MLSLHLLTMDPRAYITQQHAYIGPYGFISAVLYWALLHRCLVVNFIVPLFLGGVIVASSCTSNAFRHCDFGAQIAQHHILPRLARNYLPCPAHWFPNPSAARRDARLAAKVAALHCESCQIVGTFCRYKNELSRKLGSSSQKNTAG